MNSTLNNRKADLFVNEVKNLILSSPKGVKSLIYYLFTHADLNDLLNKETIFYNMKDIQLFLFTNCNHETHSELMELMCTLHSLSSVASTESGDIILSAKLLNTYEISEENNDYFLAITFIYALKDYFFRNSEYFTDFISKLSEDLK